MYYRLRQPETVLGTNVIEFEDASNLQHADRNHQLVIEKIQQKYIQRTERAL